MDFLKADIASKKRQLDSLASTSTVSNDSVPPSKYLKRSDLERLRQQEQQAFAKAAASEKKEAEIKKLWGAAKRAAIAELAADAAAAARSSGTTSPEPDPKGESFNLSNEDAVRRLRQKGQPIRLFGETDKDRRLRLRALELIEVNTDGGRNEFAKAMEGLEKGAELEEMKKKAALAKLDKGKGKATEGEEGPVQAEEEGGQVVKKEEEGEVLVDVSLVKTNPHKVYPQIYKALKRVLKEWEQSMAERPESVRRSTQGKMAAATQQTSAEYLKPLFKSLRKRELAPDVLLAISEITYNMQIREYLKANDSYLRLSIGNAPWPIGVTMVGIHERSGREKIFSNNVAHVLNDETSRKYIQSLKRLLTFAQTKYPPSDVSQLMG